MRYTLLSEIHDTTFRPVHNQSLFRKIEVDIQDVYKRQVKDVTFLLIGAHLNI